MYYFPEYYFYQNKLSLSENVFLPILKHKFEPWNKFPLFSKDNEIH